MKNLTKILLSIYVAIMMIAVACKKDEPTPTPPVTTPTTTPPVVKSSAKDISKFSFAALSPMVDATIDASTKAITATVPAGTDVTKLVPTITISDKSTVSPATGVAQDFSKEVSYTVTAEDGGTVVYKVNVKKEVVIVSTTVTITQKQKLPTIADMGLAAIMFTVNAKVYYLGNSKASTQDFKYFFEYDPASDKWTQKTDFPFKHNLTASNTYALNSNFIHNGKVYFSSATYGFIEYDPTTDKWTDLAYYLSDFSDTPLYFDGSLYGFNRLPKSFDLTTKKGKGYTMSDADFYSKTGNTFPFVFNKKIYISRITVEYQKPEIIDTYEVDYLNSKYIKRATTFEVPSGATNYTSSSTRYLVDGKIYNFTNTNVYVYDPEKDTFQTIKLSNYTILGGISAVIGKTIYLLSGTTLSAVQIP